MFRDSVLIGASMAVLVVLSLVTFFCSNRRRVDHSASSPSSQQRSGLDDVERGRRWVAAAAGLDEVVLATYPTTVYSSSSRDSAIGERSKEEAADAGATRCAVCLADYADGDELRPLPGCSHSFHRRCVDDWLRRRPSCPLCRSSPPPNTS